MALSHSSLQHFLAIHRRVFVLTGAGVSTDSGIPDYRDAEGAWKRTPPMTFQAFTGNENSRRRYWARSLVGWRYFGMAEPNDTHRALARLEANGKVSRLVTQNVDRLHQKAGSRDVVDLHGRLDIVRCLGCSHSFGRDDFQAWLESMNPDWISLDALRAPDGDADLEGLDFRAFRVPACPTCGGMLKPDVVFFGENIPRAWVDQAQAGLDAADAVLVVGSSLMVYSGYRLVLQASRRGLPIAALNLGRTRADALLDLKVQSPCADALAFL